jgi:hypothetical protein
MCSDKAKFVWHADKEQKAFKHIKAIISRETLLAYPDFSNDFHIHTDSSDYQLHRRREVPNLETRNGVLSRRN